MPLESVVLSWCGCGYWSFADRQARPGQVVKRSRIIALWPATKLIKDWQSFALKDPSISCEFIASIEKQLHSTNAFTSFLLNCFLRVRHQ